jgi:hypothetical protein
MPRRLASRPPNSWSDPAWATVILADTGGSLTLVLRGADHGPEHPGSYGGGRRGRLNACAASAALKPIASLVLAVHF